MRLLNVDQENAGFASAMISTVIESILFSSVQSISDSVCCMRSPYYDEFYFKPAHNGDLRIYETNKDLLVSFQL